MRGIPLAQFPPALTYLLTWEDPAHLYAAVLDNNGGEVISGVNSKSWPSDFALINSIAQPERGPAVANFYLARYWNPLLLGGLLSQDIANRVLAGAVNMGDQPDVKVLQEAINVLHRGSVEEDGVMGPLTIAAANEADPEALLAALRTQLLARYQAIVAANPADQKYLGTAADPGPWWRRATA